MSENVNKKTNGTENGGTQQTAPAQQAVAQATVTQEQPKKEGWFTTHIVNPIKRNKKVILAGLGGVATGVAGTVAYGVVQSKIAERKAQNGVQYVPEGDVNPLDPNL